MDDAVLCCASKGIHMSHQARRPVEPLWAIPTRQVIAVLYPLLFSAGFVSPASSTHRAVSCTWQHSAVHTLCRGREILYFHGLIVASEMLGSLISTVDCSERLVHGLIDICPICSAGHLTCACTFDVHSTGLPFTGDCAKFSSISENENGNDISTGCDDSTITDQTACELAGR